MVFTKNATEGINLVAYAMGNAAISGPEAERFRLGPGDRIVVTEMEHHSNLVPWQLLAQRTGAELAWLSLTDDGRLDLSNLDEVVNERTKVVAFVHQSNVSGTVNPVDQIVARAREVGALTLLDACQSVPHAPVNFPNSVSTSRSSPATRCSGQRVSACSGDAVNCSRPCRRSLTGGSMIEQVFMDHSTFLPPPQRFEAGTPPVSQAIALGAAVRYLEAVGMTAIAQHEHLLTEYTLERMAELPGVRVIGPTTATDRGGAVSFVVDGIHPHDVGQVLRRSGSGRSGRPSLRLADRSQVPDSRHHSRVVLPLQRTGRS